VTLGASGIITEEAAPIIGGFAAHEGHLGLIRVMIACAAGVWIAGIGLYALGRWRGRWIRSRFPRVRMYMAPLLVFVRRSPWRSLLAVRFAFGVRIVLPIACGAARLRVPVFLVGTAIAAVLWSVIFTLVGWLFGESAMLVLGHIRRYEDVAAGLIIVAILLVFLLVIRRRKARQAASLQASESA
jgi:membrane protein DedA with SNARE-associated domain